jgi:hypothetical protein
LGPAALYAAHAIHRVEDINGKTGPQDISIRCNSKDIQPKTRLSADCDPHHPQTGVRIPTIPADLPMCPMHNHKSARISKPSVTRNRP